MIGKTEIQIIEWAVNRLSDARKYGVIAVDIFPNSKRILVDNGKSLEKLFGTYNVVKDEDTYYGEVVTESGMRWLAILDPDEVEEAKVRERVFE